MPSQHPNSAPMALKITKREKPEPRWTADPHPLNPEPIEPSETLLRHAFAAHRQGKSREAYDFCREILCAEPQNVAALNLAGIVTFQLGETDQAISILRKVLALDPLHAAAGTNLGTALRARGNHGEAERVFRRVIEIDRSDPESHFNLGRTLQGLGRLAEAKVIYQHCLTLHPDHSRALLRLGNIAVSQGRYADAQTAYESSLNADPLNAWAHYNLGAVFQEQNELEAAERCFREALSCNPNFVEAWYSLGVVLLLAEQPGDAISAYLKALDQDPTHVGAQMNIGNALQELGSLKDAEVAYRKAIAMAPNYEKPCLNLADLMLEKGDPRAAVELCEQFLAGNPGNTPILALLVLALAEAGDENSLHRIVDPDQLILPQGIESPVGYQSLDVFNDSLARHILNHPSLTYEPAAHATRHGYHTGELLDEAKGPIADFEKLIHAGIETYRRSLPADPSHPFPARPIKDIDLRLWAVVMESQGQQDTHIHPAAWFSGVYYVNVPDAIRADDPAHGGWIEFGRPGPEFHVSFEPKVELICPQEGLMVLFPSYFYHRTIPFESSEQRISMAFDVVIHD